MDLLRLKFLLYVINASMAYKILVVFPFPGKSHSILGDGYVSNLLNAGHEVTYITGFPWTNPPKNLTTIDISSIQLPPAFRNITYLMTQNELSSHPAVSRIMLDLSTKTLTHENVKKFLNDPTQHFDVLIIEWLFTEVYSAFAAVYQCPYIWSISTEPHSQILSLIDEATNPAYLPDIFSYNNSPFSFSQRVTELWTQIHCAYLKKFVSGPAEKRLYESNIGPVLARRGIALPAYEEIKYNASFVLGNSHPYMGNAMRTPQNFKFIGGYHVDPSKIAPVSEEVKQIMDNATNGFIYFSMGSNLNSKDFPREIKRDLIKMFGGLQYTVVWKFEDIPPKLPKNVHIVKWASQMSILAHPNCRIFITHGGILSSIETIHNGVPIIGIPVFGDQSVNIEKAVYKGYAIKVDLTYSVAKDLRAAIEEMFRNPRYPEKVKKLSYIYHNRPIPPGKELVYWVEHVIETRGALYLRSPALFVPWYQKCYLDLITLTIVIILLVTLCFKTLIVPLINLTQLKNKIE